MPGVPSKTSAESAAKIMGRSCIQLTEVLQLIPQAKTWIDPREYDTVPFSPQLLYHLSERRMDYVLFPAIPIYFSDIDRQLSPVQIERFCQNQLSDILINAGALYRISVYPLKSNFLPTKWYLMSGRVMKMATAVNHSKLGGLDWRTERSLIYLYGWFLFWRLRGISIFNGKIFCCNDYYANKAGSETVLHIGDLEILVTGNSNQLKPYLGKVPSIISVTQKPEIKKP